MEKYALIIKKSYTDEYGSTTVVDQFHPCKSKEEMIKWIQENELRYYNKERYIAIVYNKLGVTTAINVDVKVDVKVS